MDKANVKLGAVSLSLVNDLPNDRTKIKSRGPLFMLNSYTNVGSRYRKEHSHSSCHEFCKYGRKHESKHDEKSLNFRRHSIDLESVWNPANGSASIGSRKKSTAKTKSAGLSNAAEQNVQPKRVGISGDSFNYKFSNSLPKYKISSCPIVPVNSEQHTESLAEEIGSSNHSVSIVLEGGSPTHRFTKSLDLENICGTLEQKKIDGSESNAKAETVTLLLESKSAEISPPVLVSEVPDEERNQVKFLSSNESKKQLNKHKAPSMPKSIPLKSKTLKLKNSSASTGADPVGSTNIPEGKVLPNFNDLTTAATVKVTKQKNNFPKKQASSSNIQGTNQNTPPVLRKTSSMSARPPLMRPAAPLLASRSSNGRMNLDERTVKRNEMREVETTTVSKPKKVISSYSKPACDTVSSKALKSGHTNSAILKTSRKAKVDGADCHEKILKVIEPNIAGKGSKPQGKELVGSSNSKEESKKWARRTTTAQKPADCSSSTYKLKFKRGKVVELPTTDNATPRRLRFRRGKVLGENPTGEVLKTTLRKKKDTADSNECNSDAPALLKKANLKSRGSPLSCQDELGKKGEPALLNEVIEETVSKLGGTTVKALVGAFETVISLQEAKPVSVA